MGKITLKDIAELVSTSPKTVSKALNDQPGVSEELRRKIKETATRLNYIPNIFGKGLSGGKRLKTIGFIVPDNVNPSYSLVLRGVEKRAAELRYSVILCNSNEDAQREKELILMLRSKHVDGIILCPAYHSEANPNVNLIQQFGLPYVLINRTIPHQEHPCLKPNNFQAAYLAGKYLIRKGHTAIIHLTRKNSIIAVEERIAGLRAAFREERIHLPETNLYRCCEVSIESACREMRTIFLKRHDFSAVLTFNDIIAFGVMKALHESNCAIPDEIAVMGFDNLLFSDISLVPLTTVKQNLYATGTIAMDVILQQIHGEFDGTIPALPEPSIIERESA